jgi:serine/threonine protein kinase/WD40 repeat protein
MQPAKEAIEWILAAAVEMKSEAERRKFVDDACAGDVQLKERVEQLIDDHFRAGSFLESPPAVLQKGEGFLARSEAPGTVIGPYKLLEQIGEGGFGLVFMAEQQHPVRRKVAVKVLKPGMDTRQVIARFEAERQALALMDHLNIARVLEAGETSTGRPFFAMELVRGVPITDYCDKNNLATRARLDLFLTVCQAVQHAHQKGIIHRDLKPSNILVTLHDGTPVVKVIDFGIAKALGQQLTDKTLYTGFAQMVGTPLYMSPEQAEMSGLDVDTRSDIYSLGVLLYELLTGTTPFDKERLSKAGYDEMRRIIREEEPLRPSTRLSTMGQAATAVSAHRQSDPKQLSQLFRGDLDWIVMKALEKDRNRRYETAAAFVADVQRYLHDEPVWARSPSAWYRFRKYARRHRWALALGGVVAAALVVIAAGSLIAALLLNRALKESEGNRIRAEGAEGTAKDAERTAVASERSATERLLSSLVDQARASRLSRRMGQRFKTLEALTEAAKIARDLNTLPAHALDLRNEAIACLGLADLRVAKEWDGWPAGSMTVDFDAALERYARTDRQGVIHIHRVSDGSEICHLDGFGPGDYGGGETFPLFSPDGRFLLLSRGRQVVRVKLWTFAGQEPAQVPLQPAVCAGIAFSPDSREIALAEADGSIRLYDLPSGRQRQQWKGIPNAGWRPFVDDLGQDGGGYSVSSVSPQDGLLAVVTSRGFGFWDLGTGTLLTFLELKGWGCLFEPSGALLTWGPAGTMRWPLQRKSASTRSLRLGPPEKLPLPVTAGRIASSRDGRVFAAAGWRFSGSRGVVWHRDLPGPPLQLPFHFDPRYIDISPDGRWVATGSHWGTNVKVSDARTAQLIREFPTDKIAHVRFSPDGRWLACGGDGRLWQVGSWQPGAYFGGYCLVFSPDSRLLAVETGYGVVRLIDPDTGHEYARLEDPNQGRAPWSCFSPDGAQLVVTNQDSNYIQVWDLRVIRQQMAELGLDWTLPPYPPPAERDGKPLRLEVELGEAMSHARALAKNNEAWRLATSAEAQARDPHRAIELAKEATQLAPQEGLCWNTLGVAHYRAGHWDDSIQALRKSTQLMSDRFESFDTFFLAMAHWQQNDKEQARKLYDRAVAWMEKHQAELSKDHVEELSRFRAEAAVLLESKAKK